MSALLPSLAVMVCGPGGDIDPAFEDARRQAITGHAYRMPRSPAFGAGAKWPPLLPERAFCAGAAKRPTMVVTGCRGVSPDGGAGGTSVSAERELVEQQISAAFSRNYAKLTECYAKDVRYVDPDGELTGVDAVVAHMKEVFDPFPGMCFDVVAIYDGDGWAIAEGVVSVKKPGRW